MRVFPSRWILPLLVLSLAPVAHPAEIHEAARTGDLDRVRTLLQANGGVVDVADERSCTPLHFACDGGHRELAGFLLDQGAEITARDVDGDTPLHWAAIRGRTETARLLLERGAPVDAGNLGEATPLHYAALRSGPPMVELLIAHGANPDAKNHEGQAPLHYAAWRHNALAAQALGDGGANLEIPDDYGRTPLLLTARETGNVVFGRMLFDLGADVDATDTFGDSSLLLAAWRGFRAFVDVLLDRGARLPADPKKRGELFVYSCERSLARLFNVMIRRGADVTIPDRNGGTLLHAAAAGGDATVIERLIASGLDPDETDRYGRTPLHWAADKGRAEAVRLLLDRGADPSRRDRGGATAFNIAREKDRSEIAEMLEQAGSPTEAVRFPDLRGAYLGQSPPGDEPEPFALGIVAGPRFEHGSPAVAPDGRSIYWTGSIMPADSGYSRGKVFVSHLVSGRWTQPQLAPFASDVSYADDVPCFAPDGQRLYFISRRPVIPGGRPTGEKVWYLDLEGAVPSEPVLLEGGVNEMDIHWQFSVSQSGAIYFGSTSPGGLGMGDIYVTRLVEGAYTDPENLGAAVNSPLSEGSPYVTPDESLLLFTSSGREDGLGSTDLYVSFRDRDGRWTAPRNLGPSINSESNDQCPRLTPDGKYLFFISSRGGNSDAHWVDARFLQELRP